MAIGIFKVIVVVARCVRLWLDQVRGGGGGFVESALQDYEVSSRSGQRDCPKECCAVSCIR